MAYKFVVVDPTGKSVGYVINGPQDTRKHGTESVHIDAGARAKALGAAQTKLRDIVSDIKHQSDAHHDGSRYKLAGE